MTPAGVKCLLCPQGYGGDYQREDNLTAYQAIVDEGITFIDTAEVGAEEPLNYLRFTQPLYKVTQYGWPGIRCC